MAGGAISMTTKDRRVAL